MEQQTRVHATAVAYRGKGVLIIGPSASGKSSLALQLMAMGCDLISDDQTDLMRKDVAIGASAPSAIKGLIEARGIGILQAEPVEADIVLIIDLEQTEKDRLPHLHHAAVLGLSLPCLYKVDSPSWPSAILQYLKGARKEPQ